MRICVFDTETTSIEKPFCYNIGYVIYDTEEQKVLHQADYVAEQIWHNAELFTTAYYADKRAMYVSRMRGRKCSMMKLGAITQQMIRDFKYFEVKGAYAFNSPFDERVFEFNCEWFKIVNPFDDIPIFDIRGYVHRYLAFTPEYQAFCDKHQQYTEKGNYSTTAETVYQFIKNNPNFEEEHTAMADSIIEAEILAHCVALGAKWQHEYKVYRSIPKMVQRTLQVKTVDNEVLRFPYNKITIGKEKENTVKISLKGIDKPPEK